MSEAADFSYPLVGSSRCPSCGGDGFEQVHPSSRVSTCCSKKRGSEVCAECADCPCAKHNNKSFCKDSIVTHKRMKDNHRLIAEIGLDVFLKQEAQRIAFLETALEHHDNGRNKGYSCLAAALLSVDGMKRHLSFGNEGKSLRDTLRQLADAEGPEPILEKDRSQ